MREQREAGEPLRPGPLGSPLGSPLGGPGWGTLNGSQVDPQRFTGGPSTLGPYPPHALHLWALPARLMSYVRLGGSVSAEAASGSAEAECLRGKLARVDCRVPGRVSLPRR